MSTKFFTAGATQAYYNPYETPYDAYINYMNVLSDFIIRVNSIAPDSSNDQDIAGLTRVINEKDELILKYEAELKRLKSSKSKINSVSKATVTVAAAKVKNSKTPASAAKNSKAPASKKPKTKSKKATKK
jgi:alpha-amylase